MKTDGKDITRRDFMKITGAGLAGAAILSGPLSAISKKAFAAEASLEFPVEKGAELRVLRWAEFVKGDHVLWEENTKKFAQQKGVKVHTEWLSWEDVRPKSAMAATVGAGPDIVVGWFDDPHLYPDRLVDVTDLCEYLGKKYGGWYDVSKAYGYDKERGRWIAVPLGSPSACITYRESWVKEAGYDKPPDKTDDFLKLAKKLKAQGHPTGWAYGHAVGDGNTWTHWVLWAFGGKMVEEDGKTIAINRQGTWDALEWAKELGDTMIPGCASWLDPHNNKAFLAGQISMTSNGISIYYAAKQKFPKLAADINHTNEPVGPLGRPAELQLFTESYIFKHTRYPNACKEYIRFMMEKEQYGPWEEAMMGYVTQSLKYYYNLPVWTADPKATPYRETIARSLPNGYAGPLGPASAAVMAEYIVVDMFAEVLTGAKTPKEAARTAEKRAMRYYKG